MPRTLFRSRRGVVYVAAYQKPLQLAIYRPDNRGLPINAATGPFGCPVLGDANGRSKLTTALADRWQVGVSCVIYALALWRFEQSGVEKAKTSKQELDNGLPIC